MSQSVGLIGDEADASLLKPFLEAASLEVRAFKDLSAFRQRPGTAAWERDIPWVVADNGSGDSFRAAIEHFASRQGAAPFYHPVCLIDRLPIRFENKVFQFGFPGAGNVLLQRICQEIDKIRNVPPDAITIESPRGRIDGRFLHAVFSSYYRAVDELFRGFVDRTYPGATHYFQYGGGDAAFFTMFIDQDDFVVVNDIALRLYMNVSIVGSHEKGLRGKLARYRAMNVRILATFRNPLDILVSVAMQGDWSRAGANASGPDGVKLGEVPNLRTIAGQLWLDQLDWFERSARILKDYYLEAVSATAPSERFFYEDALADPRGFVGRVAAALQVNLGDADLERIAGLVGSGPLIADRPQHFNRPMAGKWREFLFRAQFDILRRIGFDELLEAMGFEKLPDDLAADDPKRVTGSLRPDVLARMRAMIVERSPYRLYHPMNQAYSHDELARHWGFGADLVAREAGGQSVAGTRRDLVDALGAFLAEPATRAVLDAARLPSG